MGYRNEWKLAIKGEKIQALLTWLEYMSKLGNKETTQWFWTETEVFEHILEHKSEESVDDLIVFHDDWTKCSEPWDMVMSKVCGKCDEFSLDWAYARIGEDQGDIEENNNCGGIRIPVVIKMGNVEER